MTRVPRLGEGSIAIFALALAACASSPADGHTPSAEGTPQVASASHAGTLKSGGYVNHLRVNSQHVESIAVTKNGTRHWLSRTGAYFTLPAGGATTLRTRPRTAPSFREGQPTLQAVAASVNGRRMVAVTTTCESVQVVAVPQDARRLPTITHAQTVIQANHSHLCLDQIDSVVALAHGRFAVVFETGPPHFGSGTVYIGRPGHPFRAHRLPASAHPTTETRYLITRDPANGALYVATVAHHNLLRVWYAGTSHVPFHLLSTIKVSRVDIISIAASHGQVWILLGGGAVSFVVHGTPDGAWGKDHRLPGARRGEGFAYIAADPRPSRTLFWEANTTTSRTSPTYFHGTGIEIRRVTDTIGPARRFVRATFAELESLAVNWRGRPVLGSRVS